MSRGTVSAIRCISSRALQPRGPHRPAPRVQLRGVVITQERLAGKARRERFQILVAKAQVIPVRIHRPEHARLEDQLVQLARGQLRPQLVPAISVRRQTASRRPAPTAPRLPSAQSATPTAASLSTSSRPYSPHFHPETIRHRFIAHLDEARTATMQRRHGMIGAGLPRLPVEIPTILAGMHRDPPPNVPRHAGSRLLLASLRLRRRLDSTTSVK